MVQVCAMQIVRHTPAAPVPINLAWSERLFRAKAAQTGGVVRRKIRDVHREVGRDAFIAEVQRRGFHLVECGDQYLVICHPGQLRILC